MLAPAANLSWRNLASSLKHVKSLGRFAIILAFVFHLASSSAHGSPADDSYYQVYTLIDKGDELQKSGQKERAIAKYQQALKGLREIKSLHPTYNPKLVSARLDYLYEQIDKLSRPVEPVAVESTSETDTSKPAVAAGSGFKLLNPGTEPRLALRIEPKAGDKQHLSVKLNITASFEAPQQAAASMPPIEIPTILVELDSEIKGISDDGDISYSLTITKFDLENVTKSTNGAPELGEMIKPLAGELVGFSVEGTFTSRGISKGVRAGPAVKRDPEMKEVFDQLNDILANMLSPLPEEAVGLGAKWENKKAVTTQGMRMNQATVTEITKAEAGQVTLKTQITQNAPRQKVSNSAMPGLKMDLTEMGGTGRGQTTMSPSHLFPLNTQMAMDFHAAMAMNMGKEKQTMKFSFGLKIDLESK